MKRIKNGIKSYKLLFTCQTCLYISLLYMGAESLYPLRKTDDVYKDVSSDAEKWIDMSNYDDRGKKRPLSVGKKQKSDWVNEKWKGW